MKVSELIKKLEKFPKSYEVQFVAGTDHWTPDEVVGWRKFVEDHPFFEGIEKVVFIG